MPKPIATVPALVSELLAPMALIVLVVSGYWMMLSSFRRRGHDVRRADFAIRSVTGSNFAAVLAVLVLARAAFEFGFLAERTGILGLVLVTGLAVVGGRWLLGPRFEPAVSIVGVIAFLTVIFAEDPGAGLWFVAFAIILLVILGLSRLLQPRNRT